MHTHKLVKEVETENEAKEYRNYVWKCKQKGEILNGVYCVRVDL